MATNVMQMATLPKGVAAYAQSSGGPNGFRSTSFAKNPFFNAGRHQLIASRGLVESTSRPVVARQLAVRGHTETATEVDRSTCPSVKETVDLATFEALDIRVGLVTDAKTILDREMSEKRGKPTPSRKYLQLQVDIGCESRTIVSECRYVMDVEDAVGKKVLLVANLEPSEVEGIRSHGVILTGLNYDPTPMPRSFKLILPGLGRLPPGSPIVEAAIPR